MSALDYVVMMTDATMAYKMNGVAPRTKSKAGDSYIRPAGIKHEVRNDGLLPTGFIEIKIER